MYIECVIKKLKNVKIGFVSGKNNMARRKWNLETINEVINGQQPFIQSGYTGKKGEKKIGDEWTDSKGTWRKTKNGVVRVNKQMDAIRDLIRPRCSVCNMDIALFGDKVDTKLHARTGMCFACLEIYEQNIKLAGLYPLYEESKLMKNRLAALKEFQKNVIESIEYLEKDDCKVEMVCSNGDIVTWNGAQNEKLLAEARNDLALCEKEIVRVEEEVAKFDEQLKSINNGKR